jgi:hypothetical protein
LRRPDRETGLHSNCPVTYVSQEADLAGDSSSDDVHVDWELMTAVTRIDRFHKGSQESSVGAQLEKRNNMVVSRECISERAFFAVL